MNRIAFPYLSHQRPVDRTRERGTNAERGDRIRKELWHEPSLEHLVPSILDPTVNDARTEIADRTASCPRGLESFLKVGLPFVLIGWINQPCLERAIEVFERRQLFERV